MSEIPLVPLSTDWWCGGPGAVTSLSGGLSEGDIALAIKEAVNVRQTGCKQREGGREGGTMDLS